MSAPSDALPSGTLDVRTIAEAALLLDITVLLCLIRVFIPVPGFQGLVRLACPLPFIVLTLRRGVRAGIVATVASYILLSTFVGPVLATQILVFGGLGTFFAWASQRRVRPSITILVAATLYGVLYLLPPFVFGLLVLRIDLGKTLRDVHQQANSFLNTLGHFRVPPSPFIALVIIAAIAMLALSVNSRGLGIIAVVLAVLYGLLYTSQPKGISLVALLSGSSAGRTVLNTLHPIALFLLQHPLATLILFFAGYSLINIWAYLVVSIELYRRLPLETRRTAQGQTVDFFPIS